MSDGNCDAKITKLERALIVRKEHLDKILDHGKVWEMRGTKTSARGWVGLIEGGSGLVVGAVEVVDSPAAIDEVGVLRNTDKHQVVDVGRLVKWKFPWVLSSAFRFETPVAYEHPQGAVIWVNISELNITVGVAA